MACPEGSPPPAKASKRQEASFLPNNIQHNRCKTALVPKSRPSRSATVTMTSSIRRGRPSTALVF